MKAEESHKLTRLVRDRFAGSQCCNALPRRREDSSPSIADARLSPFSGFRALSGLASLSFLRAGSISQGGNSRDAW
jgi:hypothetical protein